MPRPLNADDRDWEFLDTIIAYGGTIQQHIEEIKGVSDQAEVLRLALYFESVALVIQKLARDYRPRLRQFKQQARAAQAKNGRR